MLHSPRTYWYVLCYFYSKIFITSGLLVLSFLAMVILVILWCCGCVGKHVEGASKGMIKKLNEFKFNEECVL